MDLIKRAENISSVSYCTYWREWVSKIKIITNNKIFWTNFTYKRRKNKFQLVLSSTALTCTVTVKCSINNVLFSACTGTLWENNTQQNHATHVLINHGSFFTVQVVTAELWFSTLIFQSVIWVVNFCFFVFVAGQQRTEVDMEPPGLRQCKAGENMGTLTHTYAYLQKQRYCSAYNNKYTASMAPKCLH